MYVHVINMTAAIEYTCYGAKSSPGEDGFGTRPASRPRRGRAMIGT